MRRLAAAAVPDRTTSDTALWYSERAASSAGVPENKTRPRPMIMARVHTASTSSRMWVEMMMDLSRAMS